MVTSSPECITQQNGTDTLSTSLNETAMFVQLTFPNVIATL